MHARHKCPGLQDKCGGRVAIRRQVRVHRSIASHKVAARECHVGLRVKGCAVGGGCQG